MTGSDFGQSVVAIMEGERVLGTGFLAGPGLIVTCAHNLGGPSRRVSVRFQGYDTRLPVRVLEQFWRSPEAEDVAVLKLEEKVLAMLEMEEKVSVPAQPLPLGSSGESASHPFDTMCYSIKGEPVLMTGAGSILGPDKHNDRVQTLGLTLREISLGLSGAPVWDSERQVVVGMIVAFKDASPDQKGTGGMAVAISSETLFEVCPPLASPDMPPPDSSTVSPAPPATAAPVETGTPPREAYLSAVGGTRLLAAFTGDPVQRAPWQSAADAFVLPVGARAGLRGQMAGSFLAALGEDAGKEFRARLDKALPGGAQARVTPEKPVLVSLEGLLPDGSPRYLIAATAYRIAGRTPDETVSLANALAAARAAIELAASRPEIRSLVLPQLGSGTGNLQPPVELAEKLYYAARNAIRTARRANPDTALKQVSLSTRDLLAYQTWLGLSNRLAQKADNDQALGPDLPAYRALQRLTNRLPQKTDNDQALGPDLLQIKGEVTALAESLLLRDSEPPIAVGVLGGWGSGKSFAMRLMRERMIEIRGLEVNPEQAWGAQPFAYVGHIYLIELNAWTFAKSNLWSSLMQTIFFELDRQIEREWALAEGDKPDQQARPEEKAEPDPQAEQKRIEAGFLRPQRPDKIRGIYDGFGRASDKEPLWEKMRVLQEEEYAQLRQQEEALAKKRADMEKARARLEQDMEASLERDAQAAAWKPLADALVTVSGSQENKAWIYDIFGLSVSATSGRSADQEAALSANLIRSGSELLAFIVFALVAGLLPWLSQNFSSFRLPGAVVAAGSLLWQVVRVVNQWNQQVASERSRLKEARKARIDGAIALQQAELQDQTRSQSEQKKQQTIKELADQNNLAALELQIKGLEAQVDRQRRLVGLTGRFASLRELCAARLRQADYENQLGLMHQVQRDLREMSDTLTLARYKDAAIQDEPGKKEEKTQKGARAFPRGPARIVLFIDDLDRCPPDRVVEVLEATQLLLKTELFVVVLAMDVRYVTRALEKTYNGILVHQGDPSGLDYIEKIIQLPYQIRPIQSSAVQGFVEKLMIRPKTPPAGDGQGSQGQATPAQRPPADTGPSGQKPAEPPPGDKAPPPQGAAGPGSGAAETPPPAEPSPPPPHAPEPEPLEALPTEAVEFTASECQFVVLCCQKVSLTPRSVKRLVNVYKLLKVLWFRDEQWPLPPEPIQQAIVLLLALSCAYPDAMRESFNHLLDALRKPDKATNNFLAFMVDEKERPPQLRGMAVTEWQAMTQDIQQLTRVPEATAPLGGLKNLTLAEIQPEIIHLVRSFSFVGDIGYDPDSK